MWEASISSTLDLENCLPLGDLQEEKEIIIFITFFELFPPWVSQSILNRGFHWPCQLRAVVNTADLHAIRHGDNSLKTAICHKNPTATSQRKKLQPFFTSQCFNLQKTFEKAPAKRRTVVVDDFFPGFTHLHPGFVELNVMEPLLVAADFTLQLVHSDRLLPERIQLVPVHPGRAGIRQQVHVLGQRETEIKVRLDRTR